MKKLHCLIIILAFSLSLSAQTDTTEDDMDDEPAFVVPPVNEQFKVGVKFGAGVSTLLGNELDNPRLTYMLNGGAYFRYRFTKHWSLQPEAGFSFRGSNFNNGQGQYSSIRAYYIDVPVLIMYGLNERNSSNILAGLQYSHMLNASLYLKDAPLPESSSPELKQHDLLGIVGTQFHTPFVGFQLLAKYGIIDINNGLLPNLNPPNTGKDIHYFIFEVNLLF